jgi:hypothetical protein
MINLLKDVHLYPAVPIAAKTATFKANSTLASGIKMMPLFPPNSKMVLPNLVWTTYETLLPISVDPVKLIN